MSPPIMALLLLVSLAGFVHSVSRRWRLLRVGAPAARFDRIGQRLRLTLRDGFGQPRLMRFPIAGLAHKAIFFGFFVLLLRSLILFARGFVDDPNFGYWLFDRGTLLGNLYSLIKDIYVLLVILGALVFLYYRLIARLPRLTHNREGVLILTIILAMMVADITHDAAGAALGIGSGAAAGFSIWEPLGSIFGPVIAPLPHRALIALWHGGFWLHVGLVLAFLNLLPYSKYFHIITAIPNCFFQDFNPPGRLRPMGDLEAMAERGEPLGLRRINQLSWKGMLDLFSCTECGRCTEHCPAAQTGKILSPKQIIIALRDFAYQHQSQLIAHRNGSELATPNSAPGDIADLVPAAVDPEALWACTTCRACEQECPVLITHIDKFVDMRRYLVQERGKLPAPLQTAFQNLETTSIPFGVAADERLKWAEGLDVPLRSNVDDVDVLFWIGCAPATDERAKGIARAVAQLLNIAGMKWAVLGPQEQCTGDAARRAGNEFLFQTLARTNIDILNAYHPKAILTACPHCYNTLKHEYPDFGGHYEVHHHADYLAQLVRGGKLRPARRVNATVVYHDSCYLGRHNGIYDSPRQVLASIPGVTLVEAMAARDRGLCCGAGGAQAFKEDEPGRERVNILRGRQLLDTGADTISTACPFCMRMLTNALNMADRTAIRQMDIAEILLESMRGENANASQ